MTRRGNLLAHAYEYWIYPNVFNDSSSHSSVGVRPKRNGDQASFSHSPREVIGNWCSGVQNGALKPRGSGDYNTMNYRKEVNEFTWGEPKRVDSPHFALNYPLEPESMHECPRLATS